MPAVYRTSEFQFLYPENWAVEEEERDDGSVSVTVSSPGGAFWSVSRYEPATDLPQLAQTALYALEEQFPDRDVDAVQEVVNGHAFHGYDLNFICLDLTNTALIRTFKSAKGAFLVLCQAEDREFADLEMVFRGMILSLLRA